MDARQVREVLERLAAHGVEVVVGGGWAVDAVAGRQTRPHADLDVAVDAGRLEALLDVLAADGFAAEVDWLPNRLELAAPDGRRVDVHPVRFRPDGSAVQAGLDGTSFEYPADGFGTGVVDGLELRCLTVAQQLVFREGYEPRPVDRHDLAVLRALERETAP